METLYKKIVDTFNNNEAVFTSRGLPVPRQVDIYMGQPEDTEAFEVFPPCIFINWSTQPQSDGQPDLLTLEVHLVQDPGNGTENYSGNLEAGLEYLRMLKAVKYVLNKLRASNTTPLRWRGERPASGEFFKYHVITYECGIDGNDESLSRDTRTDVVLTDLETTSGRLKPKTPPVPGGIIDVY